MKFANELMGHLPSLLLDLDQLRRPGLGLMLLAGGADVFDEPAAELLDAEALEAPAAPVADQP